MINLSNNIGSEKVFQIYKKVARPASVLLDKETLDILATENLFGAIDKMLEHETEVLELLSTLEEKTVEEYKKNMNLLTIPMALTEILKDEALVSFLSFARTKKAEKS